MMEQDEMEIFRWIYLKLMTGRSIILKNWEIKKKSSSLSIEISVLHFITTDIC